MTRVLSADFYLRNDVTEISRDLLGKVLCTKMDGKLTSGMITETEAYEGVIDKASHAYGGKRTNRTEVMFGPGGSAYVYLCYGIHHLFNIVTGDKDLPHAVLIRAIQPLEGIKTILKRRNTRILHKNISAGPGTVSQALGIHTGHTGLSLTGNRIWLEDRGIIFKKAQILARPRVGVEYAGDHAKWLYRFSVNAH